jgi:hypothetical protein
MKRIVAIAAVVSAIVAIVAPTATAGKAGKSRAHFQPTIAHEQGGQTIWRAGNTFMY